ncbi:MAG: hypothetical protein JNK30_01040 [Phenylobacterium sp.]|uniref:sensor histidine kinase n=1 Tax=Phenylobacterium sp. TaxID=1871053 RepID=UPI001A60F38F|nr:ATP-binding protein [Phenylobacterium sp.]MBL8769940.1 hypothetical protein [Phenylobacterium sp.]
MHARRKRWLRRPLKAADIFLPTDVWVRVFRRRVVRRAFVICSTIGVLTSLYGLYALWPEPSMRPAMAMYTAATATVLVAAALDDGRLAGRLAPAACIAISIANILAVLSVLELGSGPPGEIAVATLWTPIFFALNVVCFRPLGARIVSGLTGLGILVVVTAWLATSGQARPGDYETDTVILTYLVVICALLVQECAFAVRERRAGLRAAARQALLERRRSIAVELDLRRLQDDLMRRNRVSMVNAMAGALAQEVSGPLDRVDALAAEAGDALAATPPRTAEARATVGALQDEAAKAVEIIERIRALTSRRAAETADVAVAELVHDVGRLVRRDCELRGILLHLDVSADAGAVRGRAVQLQQVILNLLSHAMESHEGRGRGLIRIRADRPDPDEVRLRIVTDGPGVAPESVARLDRGLAAAAPEDPVHGLAISREIVEAHGGALTFGRDAEGSTMTIRLPAAAAHEAAA